MEKQRTVDAEGPGRPGQKVAIPYFYGTQTWVRVGKHNKWAGRSLAPFRWDVLHDVQAPAVLQQVATVRFSWPGALQAKSVCIVDERRKNKIGCLVAALCERKALQHVKGLQDHPPLDSSLRRIGGRACLGHHAAGKSVECDNARGSENMHKDEAACIQSTQSRERTQ